MAEIGTRGEKNDNSQEIDYFNSLPDELLILIFSLLPQTELPRYARVCRRWLRITSDECLWSIANLGSVRIPLPSLAKLVQRGVRSLNLPCAKIADPCPWRRCFPKKYKSKLQKLNLSEIKISNRGLAHLLKPCRELLHLELTNADLNRESCEAIGNNAQLQSLNLLESRGIDARGLTAILKGCQKLEKIGLNQANLSLDALTAMTSNISSTVTSLSLWKCSDRFEDRHVFDLVDRCPNLRYLNIKANNQLTQAAYDKALTLKHLEELVEGPDCSSEEGDSYYDSDSENYFSDDHDYDDDDDEIDSDNYLHFDDMDHMDFLEDAMNDDDDNDEIVDFGNIEPGDDSEDMSCNIGHYILCVMNMVHHANEDNVSVKEEDDGQSFDDLCDNPSHDGDEDIVIDIGSSDDENVPIFAQTDDDDNDEVDAGDNDFDNDYGSDDDNDEVDGNDNEVDADWDIEEDDGDAGEYF